MVFLARISIRRDGRVLAPANAAQIDFRNVGAKPDVVEIGQRNDRSPGRDNFTQFRLAHGNHTGKRRAKNGISEIDTRQSEIGLGLLQIGPGNGDVLLAASFHGLVVTLLSLLIHRLSALESRCRQIAILRGNLILGE